MKLFILFAALLSFSSAAKVTTKVRLNNGKNCPIVGLGTGGFLSGGPPKGQIVIQMIYNAIDSGYRHFDTANSYKNEKAIGRAINEVIKQGKVKRHELFITTKIYTTKGTKLKSSKKQALDNVKQSLRNLNVSYIDLMLIHRPSRYSVINRQTWSGLEDAFNKGLVKSIGVSNFDTQQLNTLLKTAKIIPAMNQIESNPRKSQRELIDYCFKHGIQVTAYSPLGGGTLITDPTIVEIGKNHNKSSAQVMIRWQIQRGVIAIPKSTKKERIKENIDVFDFSLSNKEMRTLENLKHKVKLFALF